MRPDRRALWHMLPSLQDARDVAALLRLHLGRRTERPASASFNYAEKDGVLGLHLGHAGDGGLGLRALVRRAGACARCPSWVLDAATAIHWYEAILADARDPGLALLHGRLRPGRLPDGPRVAHGPRIGRPPPLPSARLRPAGPAAAPRGASTRGLSGLARLLHSIEGRRTREIASRSYQGEAGAGARVLQRLRALHRGLRARLHRGGPRDPPRHRARPDHAPARGLHRLRALPRRLPRALRPAP